ncbi:unnamed protein product [Gongylonema pulchrum]|uniref:PAN2 UCH domain-containing protein n=1 Tax=Gongylonema pulchrum TaxID=637853 RepID=A0A3P7MS35_9BILA|nr:unnamed protein product [Gongylonema pulchrum]
MNCPEQNEAICQKCGKLARIASKRRVRVLPNVLALDVTADSEAEQNFWSTQIQAFENRPAGSTNMLGERVSKISGRFGHECKGLNYRHAHGTDSGGSATSEADTHYIPAVVNVKVADGICTVSEKKLEKSVRFRLESAVFIITENEAKGRFEHLVAAVRLKQAGERVVSQICAVDTDGSCFMNTIMKKDMAETPSLRLDKANQQSLKRAALKLLYLAQEKMTIIGYKIDELFQMLNIHVPEAQVKDVLSLYRESVDEKRADPINLARLSTRLYAKFIELKEADETDLNITALAQEMEKNIS